MRLLMEEVQVEALLFLVELLVPVHENAECGTVIDRGDLVDDAARDVLSCRDWDEPPHRRPHLERVVDLIDHSTERDLDLITVQSQAICNGLPAHAVFVVELDGCRAEPVLLDDPLNQREMVRVVEIDERRHRGVLVAMATVLAVSASCSNGHKQYEAAQGACVWSLMSLRCVPSGSSSPGLFCSDLSASTRRGATGVP